MLHRSGLISLALLQLVVGAAAAQPVATTVSRARVAAAQGDLAGAAAILEKALAAEPGSQPLYSELSELYDQRGLDYRRAMEIHRQYLARWPAAAFAQLFRERQAYLERHRSAWPLLVAFRRILGTSHQRSSAEATRAVEQLLGRAAGTTLEPELLLWLATEHAAPAPDRALGYVDRCLAALPPLPASSSERARAQSLRAQILRGLHRYGEALAALREARAAGDQGAGAAEREIRTEQWARRGLYLATFLFVALFALAVTLRPWRQPGFAWKGGRLAAWAAALVVVTLLPMLYLRYLRGFELQSTFLLLAAVGVAGLLGVKLLAPLAARAGRPVYLTLSLLLVCSGLYVAYYLGGTLSVLEWPFEAWRRMHGH